MREASAHIGRRNHHLHVVSAAGNAVEGNRITIIEAGIPMCPLEPGRLVNAAGANALVNAAITGNTITTMRTSGSH